MNDTSRGIVWIRPDHIFNTTSDHINLGMDHTTLQTTPHMMRLFLNLMCSFAKLCGPSLE